MFWMSKTDVVRQVPRATTDSNQLIGDLDRAPAPPEPFEHALHALFEVQGAEVHAGDVGFGGEALDHGDGEVHAVVFDFLVIVLYEWSV